jgi:hypothetical protein
MDTQVEGTSVAPTKEDAVTLARIYGRLYHANKAVKTAEREVKQSWGKSLTSVGDLRIKRDQAVVKLDQIQDDAWVALNALPSGTTAPGGATAQTVALEFFSNNLNRNLKARITPGDAKKINGRSFSV